MKHHVKLFCLLAHLALTAPDIVDRIASIGGGAGVLVYLGLLLLFWVLVLAGAYMRFAALRWVWAALAGAASYFLLVYQHVTDQFMTYDAFINLWNSAAFLGDTLAQHSTGYVAALPAALLLLLGVGLRPQHMAGRRGQVLCAAGPVLAVLLLSGILFVRGGEGASGLPSPLPPLSYSLLYGYEHLTETQGPRQPVRMERNGPVAGHLVVIIDESVAGNYLDINHRDGVASSLAQPWPGARVHNYGIAAAVTTCSYGSNATIRYGGTRDDYQRINATMPSIWAYARRAGMRTVYIDAQRADGALQNMMDDAERAQIDTFVQFPDVPVEQVDMAVAQEIIRQLADPHPALLFVNKVGAHFPVQDKYPDSFMLYQPIAPRGLYRNVSDTGSRAGFAGTAEDWRRYRNAYRNTLAWNVGAFFAYLRDHADLSRATLFYTADHGQDLHEDGRPGLTTHCSAQPGPEEGAVPLVVIEGAGDGATQTQSWAASRALHHNRASHYMLFPTLLRLMGFEQEAVRTRYGASLLDQTADPHTFNALFNARLHRKPVWVAVNPAQLPAPPVSDYQTGR